MLIVRLDQLEVLRFTGCFEKRYPADRTVYIKKVIDKTEKSRILFFKRVCRIRRYKTVSKLKSGIRYLDPFLFMYALIVKILIIFVIRREG